MNLLQEINKAKLEIENEELMILSKKNLNIITEAKMIAKLINSDIMSISVSELSRNIINSKSCVINNNTYDFVNNDEYFTIIYMPTFINSNIYKTEKVYYDALETIHYFLEPLFKKYLTKYLIDICNHFELSVNTIKIDKRSFFRIHIQFNFVKEN